MAHQERLFGVVRHAEHADVPFAFVNELRWCLSEDYSRWPLDPPLSDSGVRDTPNMARLIQDFAGRDLSRCLTVISSPYSRCIQTAALICQAIGHKGRLFVDLGLGEVYGPAVMGGECPLVAARPLAEMVHEGLPQGLLRGATVLGEWPPWPEDVRIARRRFAGRFLKYLSRSYKVQRDFLLVTHADCVAAALMMMPSYAAQVVASVDYGGMFLARSQWRWRFVPSAGHFQAQCLLASVVRCGGSHTPPDEQADGDEGLIVNWDELEALHVPAAASEGWEVQPHGIWLGSKGAEQPGANEAVERNYSRIRRLSRGSGLTAENVEQLLNGMGPSALGDHPKHGRSTLIFDGASEESTRACTSATPHHPLSGLGSGRRGKEETRPLDEAVLELIEKGVDDDIAQTTTLQRRRAILGNGE